jgi:MFS family permease
MRIWRIVIVAFITAVVGCFLGVVAGDYITRMLHVSEMEGGRGMMVFFFCAPLGGIAGCVIGLIVAIATKRPGWSGFLFAQGIAIFIAGAIAGIFAGIIYLGSDKPPKIDGKFLTLDFELRVPASVKIPAEPDGYSIRVSLYANNRDNRYAFIDWSSIVRAPDHITIPGHADLISHSANRSLMASIGNEAGGTQFMEVNIPARPRKEDEKWSEWTTATQRGDLSPVPPAERFSIRYRVRELDR